mmetsp:Transcript_38938/g.38544  ORF Transcript_38938/g.38544 Transcript_38938/m.38544 type:complete len:80 (-) Transcript_38938:414-653(-)
MIKYKSVGNSRHRLGSEDIALKTINQSGKDTRAPIYEGSKNNLLRNAEEKTKSDSQMVNSRTPSKLNQSQTAFNFAVGK